MTQTAAAQREAEAQRASAVTGEAELPEEQEEEEEEEIDDSKPIVSGPVGGSMATADADTQVPGARAIDVIEELEPDAETPADEADEEEQGYVLEEEEEPTAEPPAFPVGEGEEPEPFREQQPEEEF